MEPYWLWFLFHTSRLSLIYYYCYYTVCKYNTGLTTQPHISPTITCWMLDGYWLWIFSQTSPDQWTNVVGYCLSIIEWRRYFQFQPHEVNAGSFFVVVPWSWKALATIYIIPMPNLWSAKVAFYIITCVGSKGYFLCVVQKCPTFLSVVQLLLTD